MRPGEGALVVLALAFGQGLADSCDCLNWRDVYSTEQVLCGEGLELRTIGDSRSNLTLQETAFLRETDPHRYDEVCTAIFKQMDNNYCVNVEAVAYERADWSSEQWCYVSAECADLAGGEELIDKVTYPWILHWLAGLPAEAKNFLSDLATRWHTPTPVSRSLSWKLCKKHRDTRLRDMAPLEVFQMAQTLEASMLILTKMAYPTLSGSTWGEVKEAVGGGDIGRMPPALVRAIASKDPIVIDGDAADDGALAQSRIVRGTEVYELEQACRGKIADGCTSQWVYQRGRDVGDEL